MKVALVYDRVNTWGGAERILLALHKLFPNAPLYTSVFDPKRAPWAKDIDIKTSFLQKIPLASSNHELLPMLMPLAFESFSFDGYDLVISVTSEAAKGVITKPSTKHICYCLTPTRYLWSGYNEYFKNNLFKTISYPAVQSLRKWDQIAAQRPDAIVAISNEVKKRIKTYYKRDAEVIYPPATLSLARRAGSPAELHEKKYSSKKQVNGSDYFLVVSRLSKFTRYKRIDLAVEACTELNLSLKIVGQGNWESELRVMAGSTIEFVGSPTDDELTDYYKHAKALIFPGVEDFGLTMVEAQKFGKPVIAFRGGGALEIVKEGKTGYFFSEQTKDSLIKALQKFSDFSFDSEDCKKQAEKFSMEKFTSEFHLLVNKLF